MTGQDRRIESLFSIFRDIGICRERLDAMLTARLPANLPLLQYRLLNHLIMTTNRNETASEIARNSHVTRGAMSQIIARLQEKGFVEQREHPDDRRVKTIHVTRVGKAAHDEGSRNLGDLRTFANGVPLAQLEQLQAALREFRLVFEKETIVSAPAKANA